MRLPQDLLEQSSLLAKGDTRRPRQASLRRAVSGAYYALFHLLIEDGAQRAARAQGRSAHRALIRRSYAHGRMSDISRDFARQAQPGWIDDAGLRVSPELRRVASEFIDLQEARHAADYDVDTPLTRAAALEVVDLATTACATWASIRNTPEADYFLLALLLGKPRR